MIRKLCTAVATAAVLVGGTLGMAGVANAATPAPTNFGGIGNGNIVCSLTSNILSGSNCGSGRGHRLGGHFRGGRWDGDQTIILNGANYGVSDCGCGTDSVVLTPQVVQVPTVVRGIETGDGSCGLSGAYFGRLGGLRGIHRGLHF
jgi:hypothetical protein